MDRRINELNKWGRAESGRTWFDEAERIQTLKEELNKAQDHFDEVREQFRDYANVDRDENGGTLITPNFEGGERSMFDALRMAYAGAKRPQGGVYNLYKEFFNKDMAREEKVGRALELLDVISGE